MLPTALAAIPDTFGGLLVVILRNCPPQPVITLSPRFVGVSAVVFMAQEVSGRSHFRPLVQSAAAAKASFALAPTILRGLQFSVTTAAGSAVSAPALRLSLALERLLSHVVPVSGVSWRLHVHIAATGCAGPSRDEGGLSGACGRGQR